MQGSRVLWLIVYTIRRSGLLRQQVLLVADAAVLGWIAFQCSASDCLCPIGAASCFFRWFRWSSCKAGHSAPISPSGGGGHGWPIAVRSRFCV